jgi:hypothetical protein
MCPACHREVEDQFLKCRKYLKENSSCTLTELSMATDVPVKLITRFIREGRFSAAQFENLAYPCDGCGAEIKTGNLCVICASKFTKSVNELKSDEARKAQQQQQANKAGGFLKDR